VPKTLLAVDDSATMRAHIRMILSADRGIEVVGEARDPLAARDAIKALNPDVMTLDVEIPGREPYVSTGDFLVPRGVAETIPGASLDVAVDARDQNQILVLGPGGFSGPWIRIGPPAPY